APCSKAPPTDAPNPIPVDNQLILPSYSMSIPACAAVPAKPIAAAPNIPIPGINERPISAIVTNHLRKVSSDDTSVFVSGLKAPISVLRSSGRSILLPYNTGIIHLLL
ncbi:hypothetical protein QYM41_17860, partial [Kocuria sp. CPCC 205268]|uniref:hypothetical protein n=1 Tax=Kocuria oxytropis TaxID=3058913 RepID=UPI0034D5E0D7